MKRGLIAAVAMTAMIAVGCDDDAANTKPAENTADKAASETKKAAENVKETVKEGAEKKENAGGMLDAASDAVKKQAEDLVKQIDAAVEAKDWNKADSLLKQFDDLAGKLPKAYQDQVKVQIENARKAVAAGKAAMPG